MSEHEALIARILAASGIVGRGRRNDVAREMCSHIEDLIEEERAAGRDEGEIERLVALRFGGHDQIAQEFATVYRSQRIALSVLSYSLLAILSAFVVATFVYTMQYGAVRWFGVSPTRIFNRSHIEMETLLLAGLTFGYLGLYFGERRFEQKRFAKALGFIGLIFAVAGFCLELSGLSGAAQMFAGFFFAAFVRTIERVFAHSAFKLVSLLFFFTTIGMLEPYVVTNSCGRPAWFLLLPLYLAIAVASQFVSYFAGVFERQILSRHFA